MKNESIQYNLKQIARAITNGRMRNFRISIDEIIQTMDCIGGLTGISARQGNLITLVNHTDSYNLPIRMPEYGKNDAYAKRVFPFFEQLAHAAYEQGVPKSQIQFHLGRDYASKHHPPEWFRNLGRN